MKIKYLALFFLCLLPTLGLAEAPVGFGGVANSMMTPVSILADFVHTACLLIGMGFLFASIVKYFEHRRSPLMVPISTVVFLLIAGALLICLPLLSYFTEGGIPYSLWR